MNALLKTDALLDTNVLIAAVVEAHQHHRPSLHLLAEGNPGKFAVSAHSYAEAYSTLTRRGERGHFQFTPCEAWAALETIRAVTRLVGLNPAQTLDTVRAYAQGGGIGARLYDGLIGEAAVVSKIATIVTWNVAHMTGLFPRLRVVTPTDYHQDAVR